LGIDLRILFLILLGLTAVLFLIRQSGVSLTFSDIGTMILDVILVPSALLTVLVFFILLFGVDYRSLILQAVDRISSRTVSFISAVPPELQNTIQAKRVERHDTDGDEFEEWVVFYDYDLQSGLNPVQVTIYDNDRGNPPVIFPYQLRVPDRDYLSEYARGVRFSLENIVTEPGESEETGKSELLIQDGQQLTIFKYNGKYDTNIWDPPSDSPPRYTAIGAFKGTGGVSIDLETEDKLVTVIDSDKFSRSQLAERAIYRVNPATNTYWDDFDSTQLAAPIMSTVDFFRSPPENILTTPYPEKIVLAFYASTCGEEDTTLCRWAATNWTPDQFLLRDDVAWNEYSNPAGGPAYFGLNSFTNSQNLQVQDIRYYPSLEAASTRELTTGPQPTSNVVDITFTVGGGLPETRSCAMVLTEGQWLISECVPSNIMVSDRGPTSSTNTSLAQ
jgi:hypothetical protein